MNIYVAGKTQALEEVRAVQRMAIAAGHKITFDWTKVVAENGGDANEVYLTPEYKLECAGHDMNGVHYANIVIAIGHPNLCGTLWECGMAAAWGKPLWLLFWERCSRASVFEFLPNVQMIKNLHHLQEALYRASPSGIRELINLQSGALDTDDLIRLAARWDEGSLE